MLYGGPFDDTHRKVTNPSSVYKTIDTGQDRDGQFRVRQEGDTGTYYYCLYVNFHKSKKGKLSLGGGNLWTPLKKSLPSSGYSGMSNKAK